MANDQQYLSVMGRQVQGDIFVPQTKDKAGRPLTDKQGNPKEIYFFAVAVPKTDETFNQTYGQMQAIAQAGFPGGQWQQPTFSWKVVDGDSPDNITKPGMAGCWIVRLSSGFPIPAYTKGAAQQITDPNAIKRGYFIRAFFTAKPNDQADKPGLYLNTAFVEMVAYGEEIRTGPDAAALISQHGQAALPPGASETPVGGGPPIQGPAPGQMPGQAPMQQPGQMPGQAPMQQPGQMPGQAPMQQPGQMPGQAPMQQPGQMPGQAPMQQPGQMPGQAPMQQPGQMPGQAPMQQPGQMPGQAPMQQPGQMPGQAPMQQPGQMPGQAPMQQPGQMPGQAGGVQPAQDFLNPQPGGTIPTQGGF